MRRWGIAGIVLVILSLVIFSACTIGKTEPTAQQVKVTRGDLTVSTNGSGNIETLNDIKLTFASSGKLDKIYVKEGDQVSRGKVLAKLDTSALDLAKTQAQISLNQAKLAVSQAQLAQQSAEYALSRMDDKKQGLELALLKTQIDSTNAKYLLDKAQETYKWPEVEASQSDVDKAKSYVEYANQNLANATTSAAIETWTAALARAQASLDAAQAKLDAQLKGYDPEEVAIKKMQLDAADMALRQAQKSLDEFDEELALEKSRVANAKDTVEQAKASVQLAEQSLAQTQKQLDEATIFAPFDGVVALVGAKEGDMVPTPSVSPKAIVQLVDTTRMELVVQLDEIDMPDVEVDQEAVITVDALPGQTFKGKVSIIYPLPNTVGGVVLYNVKMNLEVPPGSGLRIGMSASVDIIINKKSNVLILPSRAIEQDSQGNSKVSVMVNGKVEEKSVVTGISNGINTEIVSGLSEGESVVIQVKPATPQAGLL